MRDPVWRMPGIRPLFIVSAAGFSGYSALLPVAPLWAAHGGAGTAGAGLVNGVLLLATVLTQLVVPRLLSLFGYGRVVVAGLLFMGLPGLAYSISDALGPVLAWSAVRGVGFGIITVTGSAVVPYLVPASRRGAAIGIYGLAVAVPNLLLLPAAVAIADTWGFGVVFALSALPVLGIPAAFALGRVVDAAAAPDTADTGPARLWDRGTVLAVAFPTLVLFSVTMGGGALLTFIPQICSSARVSTLVLLVLGLTAALSRWLAGHLADRHGPNRFLVPLLVCCATGLVLCAASAGHDGAAAPMFVGAAVVGVAYGALQNLTLVVAFRQVARHQIASASAGWNIGFDAGTAAGSVVLGFVAGASSFGVGLLLLAGSCLVAITACIPILRPARPSPEPAA